ncbi:ABC-three component system middle component 1 [Chryseobacterium sp. CBSDS_008]|uniref:ABC-three component system middle component 1 n=1 Tax=Chryseobacterium sp. CBSDS_008 TaxID=3415265 RepID=UPI003CFB156F
MKDLIEQIAIASELRTMQITDNKLNPTLFYFEDRDDFYILICAPYNILLHHLDVEEEISNLDYGINAYLDTIKGYEQMKAFGSIVDFNLSSIIVVELDTLEDENILRNVHKIEENYKIAKKYILPYLNSDLEKLTSEIAKTSYENLPQKLNSAALHNSALINIKEESWYQLLMNLFIKIPFLNYQSGSFGLTTISNLFEGGLSDQEKSLLEIIAGNYEVNMDIESFVAQFQIDNNE